MRPTALLASMAAAAFLLAGCAGTGPGAATSTGPSSDISYAAPTFSAPILVDSVRAGGEPVIAVTHAGTLLVSAHPGFTHYHPSSDPTHPGLELLTPVNGQSYIWRSTDNGSTWTPIGLPVPSDAPDPAAGAGPRNTALGVSDPEFTVMADGTICFTDLESLVLASTSCSTDDGVTWGVGNAAASGRPVDRQWLASYGNEFYFSANYLAGGANFRVSTDRGLTWTDRGTTKCSSDLVANPANGHLIQGCNGAAISVSTDGGRTWSDRRGPANATSGGSRIMAEPALDAGGNIWIAWTDGERGLYLAGTPDEGATWPWRHDLTPEFRAFASNGEAGRAATNGSYVWPWISAGSAGRVAVTWIGSFDTVASSQYEGAWYIFSAATVDATGTAPIFVSQLTPDPIHVGPICQSGTACQVSSVAGNPSGDRRLGDFFETTVEPGTGYLLGAWSNTHERPADVISHVQFVRQTGGFPLLSDADRGVFTPTQG